MARLNLTENNRPERYIHSVRNSESTAAIPAGTPVILNLSATPQPTTNSDGHLAGFEDGLQVVLPSTAAATSALLFPYGVALAAIANQQLGEVLVHGVGAYALFVRGSRSASTASWPSSASTSSAGGFLLSIDTVNNAYASFTPSSISLANASSIVTTSGINAQAAIFQAIMLDSLGTAGSLTSTSNDARTYSLTLQRVFIREM